MTDPSPSRRVVVIVGGGPRTPAAWPDGDVWVINHPGDLERWDRLFQLHSLAHLEQRHGPEFVYFLQSVGPPRRLVMVERHEQVPRAEAFPWRAVIADQPDPLHPYFTHSAPLLVALATIEGYDRIVLDGFEDRPGTEHERACLEHHLTRARSRGVDVSWPSALPLFPHADIVYGLQESRWIEAWLTKEPTP